MTGLFLRNLELSFNLILGQQRSYNLTGLGRSPVLTCHPRQAAGGLFSLSSDLSTTSSSAMICRLMKHSLPLLTGAGSRSPGWAAPVSWEGQTLKLINKELSHS